MKVSRMSYGNNSGFTLLELLLSLGILAIILSIAATAMGSYSRILGSLTEERANMHEVRLAMEKITDVISTQRKDNNLVLQLADGDRTIWGRGSIGNDVYLVSTIRNNNVQLYLDNGELISEGEAFVKNLDSITFKKVYGTVTGEEIHFTTMEAEGSSPFILIDVTANQAEVSTLVYER